MTRLAFVLSALACALIAVWFFDVSGRNQPHPLEPPLSIAQGAN
jgi:hypothetical protein